MSYGTGSPSLSYRINHWPIQEPLGVESWSDLHALEITSTECLSKLQSLLNCPSEIAAARSLKGNDAETLINFLDRVSEPCASCLSELTYQMQVLEQSCLDVKLRQRCLRLLSKICKAQRVIPASYLLQKESIHIGGVLDHGGFSEVSDGKYLEYFVAIKDLKTNKDDPDKMFKACSVDLTHLYF